MASTNGTANGHSSEQLVGRVLSVNDKGLRLEGRDGWVNFSKFAQDLVPPSRGSVVAIQLDGQGFIRRVEAAEHAPEAHQAHAAGRETAITRLAVLKAAAEFAATRQEVKSKDVLAIAAAWEKWVLREEGS
jgi:hypothetical protein